MKHASAETIATLEPLLERLRAVDGLKEKKPGIYYVKSRAFLHFHEDGEKVFADARLNPTEDFVRLPATSKREQDALVRAVKTSVKPASGR